MKILFLHANTPDYLSAGLFHGLRTLLGNNCVDLPRFDCMYSPLSKGIKDKIRGNAFTLYGLLDEIPEMVEQRFFIWHKNIHEFDLYIIADIWNQWETYIKLVRIVSATKIVVIDPSDSTRVFPFNNFSGNLIHIFLKWYYFKNAQIKYFKREIPDQEKLMTGLTLLPNFISKYLLPKRIYPINFSIPEEKITKVSVDFKTKKFTTVIVDEEVQNNLASSFFIPLGQELYKFSDENEYYKDIQLSKFGITTKRSGWDCLRHYEYAANGAVLCFKNLTNKNKESAPHGLNKTNCIFYDSSQNLVEKLESISEQEYLILLENTYKWVVDNTTIALAKKLINQI